MVEAQAVAELAKLLYDFLSGTFFSVTWPGVAARFCLEKYWPGKEKGTQPILFGTLIAVNLKLFYIAARFLRKTPHQRLLVHGEQTDSNRFA
jgi:hypothetical protein